MSAYEYTALDLNGKQQHGSLEADSPRHVRQLLRARKLTPMSVESVSEQKAKEQDQSVSFFQRGISTTELASITRQLATLVQAAMPLEEALTAIAAQQETRRLKNIVLAIKSKVLEGYTLSQSMEAFPKIFPKIYRATVAAGEHASHLDRVLNQLADYSEARLRSRQKIQQALLYPIILIVTCLGIVGFLMGYVVPDIIKVFVDTGQSLPSLTQLLITGSEFLQNYWPLLIGIIIVAIITVRQTFTMPGPRLSWHKTLLKLPLLGRFSRSYNTARFASTLSILTRSGVSLVDALHISAQVMSNDAIRQAVEEMGVRVSEGSSLNIAMAETGLFPPLMQHMIASGEATGELDQMLERAAGNQQQELDGRIAILLGLFEPLMLVVMGGIVMTIVIAILLPILNMNQLLA